MRLYICVVLLAVCLQDIVCPPVQPDVKPVEGDSPDEDPVSGLSHVQQVYFIDCLTAKIPRPRVQYAKQNQCTSNQSTNLVKATTFFMFMSITQSLSKVILFKPFCQCSKDFL